VLALRGFKSRKLLGRRLFLILGFPVRERLAIDSFARGSFADVDSARLRRFAIPVGETVSAEARGDHQIDVLHVGTPAEMVEKTAECGRFELELLLVHDGACFGLSKGLWIAFRRW
jgi:hypothetical protein